MSAYSTKWVSLYDWKIPNEEKGWYKIINQVQIVIVTATSFSWQCIIVNASVSLNIWERTPSVLHPLKEQNMHLQACVFQKLLQSLMKVSTYCGIKQFLYGKAKEKELIEISDWERIVDNFKVTSIVK